MPFSFGILSTYPPTQCGLASFSAALATALEASDHTVGVVRVVDTPEPIRGARVVQNLTLDSHLGSLAAARALNEFDIVVVQHEYGVYGGRDGADLLDVLDALSAQVIVVAHTVLSTPTAHQRDVLERVVSRADAVVTMSKTARDRLIHGYRVDTEKVVVIPHGALTALTSRQAPDKTRVPRAPGPPRLLTWGLLGPGKGIEAVIDALSMLDVRDPVPHYHVVGQTHPRVLARDGEAYRHALKERAGHRGVGDQLTFHPAYLDTAALRQVIDDSDVVILPYESTEQVTSGVLIEAVAAGKPVVATAFPHAVELLAGGAGLVVPHGDPAALAGAIRRVLCEPSLRRSMAARAAAVAPDLRWSHVANEYSDLASKLFAASNALVA